MLLSFARALEDLGPNAIVQLANETRPPAAYLFDTILPEQNRPTYYIDAANIIITTTMAGLAAMDSPYPPGGRITAEAFLQKSAKIANEVTLPEEVLREMQELLMRMMVAEQPTEDFITDEALNFLQKVIIQAHLDTMEWLRGRALNYGEIDWTFNKKQLKVNYGIPAANFLPNRTGNDAYGGSTSKFWTDVRAARRALRQNLRAIIAHPDLIDDVVYNEVNKAEIIAQDGNNFTIRRLIGDNEREASDSRETVTITAYGLEGEKLEPDGTTTPIPFQPRDRMLFLGQNTRSDYRVGEGSTDDPQNDLVLGYTHIAPTVEGDGVPGRWAQLFTPQGRQWELTGQGVTNGLPVIRAPKKIVVGRSAVS